MAFNLPNLPNLPNSTQGMGANPATLAISRLSLQQQQVLRQTYMLLAISMIPTILGAALAVYMGLGEAIRLSPKMSMLVFFAGAYGLMYMVGKNNTNSSGVLWLLIFTFFMGVMLSNILSHTLILKNGANLIMLAMGGTASIFVTMAVIASMIQRDLSGLGKFLSITSIVLMVAGIGGYFLHIPLFSLLVVVAFLVIFSIYLMYDLNKIMRGGEINYINATLNVYLDIYNIFTSLLSLLSAFGGRR